MSDAQQTKHVTYADAGVDVAKREALPEMSLPFR